MARAVFGKHPRKTRITGSSFAKSDPPSFGDGSFFEGKRHNVRIHRAETKRARIVVGGIVPFSLEVVRTPLKIGNASTRAVIEVGNRVNALESHRFAP